MGQMPHLVPYGLPQPAGSLSIQAGSTETGADTLA